MSNHTTVLLVAMVWGGVSFLTYHGVGTFEGKSLETLALIGVAWCFVFLIKLSAEMEDLKDDG